MKEGIFSIGSIKTISHIVNETDVAAFNGDNVHEVYSTFALGRDAEWACRQFVLEMKEDDEEGIGTFLNIKHHSPAKIGTTVSITAQLEELRGNNIDCSFVVKMEDKLIATGTQGQKILKKTRIEELFETL